MEVRTSAKYMQGLAVLPSAAGREPPSEVGSNFGCNKGNPFSETLTDPLCKLNLKETSDFVKAFPVASTEASGGLLPAPAPRGEASARRRRLEAVAPSTPGRPVFGFGNGNLSRKAVPSKWEDAEKWLISTSCHSSPAHAMKPVIPPKIPKQTELLCRKGGAFPENSGVAVERTWSSSVAGFHGLASEAADSAFASISSEVLLKDRFTDSLRPVFSDFQYADPAKEGFFLRNSLQEQQHPVKELDHRDVGTEMTPLGSLTPSRCHTPFQVSSPARHNTPTSRSGLLAPSNSSIDVSEIKECHLAKLQFDSMVSNWSSREEEEEEISKSLRHFEMGTGKNVSDLRASAWEDEEKNKICTRYQREEAKIQAWLNLQDAKAEAESRKLEVKIQKMRSSLEEKLMRKMAAAHRRAEEWRAAAQLQHAQLQHAQEMSRASEQARKMKTRQETYFPSGHGHAACGCFPRNNHF